MATWNPRLAFNGGLGNPRPIEQERTGLPQRSSRESRGHDALSIWRGFVFVPPTPPHQAALTPARKIRDVPDSNRIEDCATRYPGAAASGILNSFLAFISLLVFLTAIQPGYFFLGGGGLEQLGTIPPAM